MQGKIQEKPGKVSFGQAIKDFFYGYFDFSGRSTRAGFWYIELVALIVGIVFGVVLTVCALFGASDELVGAFGLTMLLLLLVTIIPSIALMFRRFHDVGFTTLGVFTVLIAYILLIIFGQVFKFLGYLALAIVILMWIVYVLPTNCLKGKLGFMTIR